MNERAPTGTRWQLSNVMLWLPALLISGALAVPVGYLVLRAVGADWALLSELVLRPRSLRLLINTVVLAAAVVVVATLIALPLAWLVTRSDLRARGALTVLGTLPLAVPGYVTAFVLLGASGPNGALAEVTGLIIPRVSGFWGALWALSVYTFPYIFLNVRAGLAGLDPAVEESARSLGAGRWRVFRHVVLPQLRPSYLTGALLVILHVIGDFGVVSLMRFETLSYALYLQYTGAYDRIYAAWIAIGLLLLTSLVLVGERRMLRGFVATHRLSGRVRSARPESLGRWKIAAYGFIALLAIQCLILPMATLFFWAGGEWVVRTADLLSTLGQSILGAAPAALLATVLAVPVSYIAVRRRGTWSRLVERMAWFGYATPPLAFALALIVFSLRVWPAIYQTLGLLVAAYALHFLAEAVGPVRNGLIQTPRALHEAARGLGRGPLRAFVSVTLPLLRPGLLTSAAFVFLAVMKELPLTFLLSPIGFETLALNVWSYTNEALYAYAAPYALVVIAFSAGLVFLLLGRSPGSRSSNE